VHEYDQAGWLVPRYNTAESGERLDVKSSITYEASGVSADRAESALSRLIALIGGTHTRQQGPGSLKLPIGFFANVLDLGQKMGLAISTDGVGSKLLLAQEMDCYTTIGIDCVAMNVNDVLCVGADPMSLVDYIAVQEPDPHYIALIAEGLAEGCKQADINISGGEIAQLRDVLRGVENKFAFDLVGTCVGVVSTDRIIVGRELTDGDVIIGLRSSGVHSNGLTLIRKVLLEHCGYSVHAEVPELGRSLGEELLRPTIIYAANVRALLASEVRVKGIANITSDGILNLSRLYADVDYRIDYLPEPQPIFRLVQEKGGVSDAEMYQTFNMGIGFCVIVARDDAELAMQTLRDSGGDPFEMGTVQSPGNKVVKIPKLQLQGTGHNFL
jgi:phosphoribosylformylglycinamidine cyclo-ligase